MCSSDLERAAAEFDTAVIGTIHAICSRILRLAGMDVDETGDDELRERVLAEVVNDAIIAEAVAGRQWEEDALRAIVKQKMADPFLEFTPSLAECAPDERELVARLHSLITDCVKVARARMQSAPGFDEILVQAWERVTVQPDDTAATKARKESFRQALRDKFKLAIVDEAQDTNRLQWEFFHSLFPPTGSNTLISVGDPKQAIYRFRGADVTAFVRHAQDGVALEKGTSCEPDALPKRTLSINRRSDGPLLAGLNAVMDTARFGEDIPYQKVEPAPGRESSQLAGLRPVEFLDVGTTALVEAAMRKVYEVLSGRHFRPSATVPFKPGEVCVLVRTNAIGAAIARRLWSLGIRAVTEGTASVMDGQMAADLRCLLEAMERPSDAGRARRAAATVFFGVPLETVVNLGEAREQEIQATIASLRAILQRQGIAAMATEVMANREMAKRIATGDGGDRRIVDFDHIVELLNDASKGRGSHAREMLEHVDALAAQDAMAELVSRRVESDADAVTIMTVHAAKGLQFPCVIIVDGWASKRSASSPELFHRGGARLMDIRKAMPRGSIGDEAKQASLDAENDELRRLLYVAVTRPQHHVSILRVEKWTGSILASVMPGIPASASDIAPEHAGMLAVRSVADLPEPRPSTHVGDEKRISVARVSRPVCQTYRRTSYSGISKAAAHVATNDLPIEGHGHDEDIVATVTTGTAADHDLVQSVASSDFTTAEPDGSRFTIAALPAGTAFGTIAHEVFERVKAGPAVAEADLPAAVERVVGEVATARFMRDHKPAFAAMIADAFVTPFGGPPEATFRHLRFADFAPEDRLAEMNFEMGLASLGSGVQARHVGRVLKGLLPERHPLSDYADRLAGPAFNVPLAGLINGSIDAVLRLPGSTDDNPLVLIADYKTNRLHDRDARHPLAAYAPAKLVTAMADHHYPLQALVYGTAIWRMLRWRLGRRKPAGWDPGDCIAGVVYGFVRGMKGPDTPVDAAGSRYGVFTWQPPPNIWRRLSDLFAGDLTGVEA